MIIKPDYNLKCVYDIDLDELEQQGIKVIMFDLDSTIMISKSGEYRPETVEWLNDVKQKFTVAVIGHASKPNPKKMRSYLKDIGIEPKQAVMVGDRPLTDIVAGKLLGCKTILVDSINAENENLPTRFVRKLERSVIR